MSGPTKYTIEPAVQWYSQMGWEPFPFQIETWHAYLEGYSGIVNAPTGSGKTHALCLPILLDHMSRAKETEGLKALWITPIRALTKEICQAFRAASKGLGASWRIEIRSGDTKTSDRARQWRQPPDVLVTTPESIHIMLAAKDNERVFRNLDAVIIDEWHELMGSKRGVLVELGISRFKALRPDLRLWGISATIANMDEAMDVLLGQARKTIPHKLIRANQEKVIAVESIIPEEIETYPWSGHLGLKLVHRVLPIIRSSKSCLIFTNTRGQCEIWYQKILAAQPDLAGQIAMHHGSISRALRDWVEEALHAGRLKAVVCTSSLDLGVDFRPVESVIQIGSPKGVSRFIQRAGRSGHQPGAISRIYFVPTHALELVEGAALRSAVAEDIQEDRIPYIRSFDVLIQYLMTLAVSGGFRSDQIFDEVRQSHCYASLTREEWDWLLHFLVYGGQALSAYDEYRRMEIIDGVYRVTNPRIARRHRLSIGTIVSDVSMQIRFVSGKKLGNIEEWFISQLKIGDVFWFAGRSLELVRIKEMIAYVRRVNKKAGRVPSWLGGRMPLSSKLAKMLRRKLYHFGEGIVDEIELEALEPLFQLQKDQSYLPTKDEFFIEYFPSDEGYHLVMYPFEGRFVHEGMGALLAKRLSRHTPITFSIAMNDYGLELLSDRAIDVEKVITPALFQTNDLILDIQASINSVEMARRRFREIARISGLIFQGFPGKPKKDRHLQASSQLLFDVFKDYDPENLLYLQTYDEVMTFQLEEARLRQALDRIRNQKLVISQPKQPTPFAFPIIVDRLREKLTSESLESLVRKMVAQYDSNNSSA